MPINMAPSGSSASARMALPTSVSFKKANNTTAITMAPPQATSRGTSTSASPTTNEALA